jgi:hypothetical protein
MVSDSSPLLEPTDYRRNEALVVTYLRHAGVDLPPLSLSAILRSYLHR